jgi:hypothetical protein
MQKQFQKRNRTKRAWHDANRRLSESESTSVRGLVESFADQDTFATDYLRSEYLSKLNDESLFSADSRRNAAISKWFSTERTNAETNRRLRAMDRGYNILPRVSWYTFLRFVQRTISDILGPLDNSIVLGSFSGGASTSRRRTESNPAHKYAGRADVTSGAVPYVGVIHQQSELFRHHNIFYSLNEVEGAVLFTVPKKADIDRCACKEPDINMFLQKGVGRYIRSRLLRFGVNLNDQSINRRYARIGSLDSSLATLDLSAASDSVTTSCVQALLPTDWYLYLNDIRSQSVQVDGETYRTEMFSSMGNGFTFELESLIFLALMRACAYFEGISGVISVYGDDIIIPSGLYDTATWVLSVFGFTPNASKSFHTGPFRESCGGHYLLGNDVTPFYLKRPATHLTDVIRVANQLRRWTMADPCRRYEFPQAFLLWNKLKGFVPRDLWGGRDYALDTQLVTPDFPISRLVRVTEKPVLPDLGSYIAWHVRNRDRSFESLPGFDPLNTTKLCRKRRAPQGAPTLDDWFYEELVTTPETG